MLLIGADDGKKNKAGIAIAVGAVVVVIVILIILIAIFIMNNSDSDDVEGFHSRNSNGECTELNEAAITKLYRGNRDVLVGIRGSGHYDINKVKCVYESFLNECDMDYCPKRLNHHVNQILKYIDAHYTFYDTEGYDYKVLQQYMLNLDRYLNLLIVSAEEWAETAQGDGIPVMKQIKKDRYEGGMYCDPYESLMTAAEGLSEMEKNQLKNDMNEEIYYMNHGEKLREANTWIEDNSPQDAGYSAMELLLREGKATLENGDILTYQARNFQQIPDCAIVEPKEKCVADPRFPETGMSMATRDWPYVADYRGYNVITN